MFFFFLADNKDTITAIFFYIHMMNQIMEGTLSQSSSIIFQVDQFPNLCMITKFLA